MDVSNFHVEVKRKYSALGHLFEKTGAPSQEFASLLHIFVPSRPMAHIETTKALNRSIG